MMVFFSLHHRVQTGSEAHPASHPMGTGGLLTRDKSGRGVKLTTRIHLVPRLRIRLPGVVLCKAQGPPLK